MIFQKYWFRMELIEMMDDELMEIIHIIEVVIIDTDTMYSIFLSISIFLKSTLNLFYWYLWIKTCTI